jgi:serine/threonine-protein kinase
MSSSDPLVGHVLDGRYEILRKLARGGMAGVYLASDRRLTRTVAVKVMHDSLGGDPEFVTRFDREARAAARLSHPNVVAVFDQGIDAGRPYIVMEYVEGCTLRHLITREAPMSPERALDLLLPVITAVATAHEAGIIHRDLKPENVLISERGQIKVADFGLARAVTAHTATATGTLIGTVSYIAPELVTTGKGDTRADVYALGVVLFEMLTGRKPHTGETPIQVAYAHVHNEIPAPSTQAPASGRNPIPPYLDAMVTSATTRDRTARPADATVLLDHARRARRALADHVMDDPALTHAMRATTLEGANAPTEQVPALVGASAAPTSNAQTTVVNRTATLRFTPSTPVSPGHPPVTDGMPYYDLPGEPAASVQHLRQRQVKRRRRGLVSFIVILLLTVALGVGAWWMFSGRFMDTPAFAGMTQKSAEQFAAENGLTIGFEQEYSDNIKTGQVIRTNPAEGSPVLRGGSLVAYLSKGPQLFEVPQLQGMTLAQAQPELEQNQLQLGKVDEQYHENAEPGTIIGQATEAGEKVKRDSKIGVTLSKGPPPVEIVSFKGKPFEEAKAHYEAAGLKVEIAEENFHDKIAKDAVISSDPAKGTLKRGKTISFVVSKGPELVKVPNVWGMNIVKAREVLTGEGFEVKTEEAQPNWGFNIVAWSDPKGGDMAPKGSTITLGIS